MCHDDARQALGLGGFHRPATTPAQRGRGRPDPARTFFAMARILVTGMSGTGKSTVLAELARRGHLTVDTDYDDWVLPDGHWDEPRMAGLLARHVDLVVQGTVENQGHFYDRFDHVVLLSAPLDVLIERVRARTNNPYGSTAEQQAEIAGYLETVEPLLRRGATLELDARSSVADLADAIEALIGPGGDTL
jgi:shikimate kinase